MLLEDWATLKTNQEEFTVGLRLITGEFNQKVEQVQKQLARMMATHQARSNG